MRSTELPEFNEDSLCIPKRQKRALSKRKGSDTDGGWGLTGHGKAPRTSKPSSLSEEPNSRILRGYCGAEGCGNPDPFHIKSKAHAEEEEMSEDEQRRSKLLGDIAEDNLVLGKLRSRKEKAAQFQGQPPQASQTKRLTQWATMGAWWRSNSRIICHVRIKCPQLTIWPH